MTSQGVQVVGHPTSFLFVEGKHCLNLINFIKTKREIDCKASSAHPHVTTSNFLFCYILFKRSLIYENGVMNYITDLGALFITSTRTKGGWASTTWMYLGCILLKFAVLDICNFMAISDLMGQKQACKDVSECHMLYISNLKR